LSIHRDIQDVNHFSFTIKAGVAVEMLNCELSSAEEVAALIKKTSGFCLGAPTLGGHIPTPVSNALGVIVANASRDYPSGVFGSFGWSGEAVDLMESRLKGTALRVSQIQTLFADCPK
jgi:flavorubredoxin